MMVDGNQFAAGGRGQLMYTICIFSNNLVQKTRIWVNMSKYIVNIYIYIFFLVV